MSKELKPCPFCGGEATLNEERQVSGPDNWYAECTPCGVQPEQAYLFTRDVVITAWNTRA